MLTKKSVLSFYEVVIQNLITGKTGINSESVETAVQNSISNMLEMSHLDETITTVDVYNLINSICERNNLENIYITEPKQSHINNLIKIHNDAEYWFKAAINDISGGEGYFPVDPFQKRVPESIRKHNNTIKQSNFISCKVKLNNYNKLFIYEFKKAGNLLNKEDRATIMNLRKSIKNMMTECDSYAEVFERLG